MGEEDFADFVAAIEEDERRRRYENSLFTSEYAMESTRDTIYYIRPMYAENINLTIDLKRKRKRCINI